MFNNDLRKFGGQISKSGADLHGVALYYLTLKLAVANDFTNALEIKTTRMRREYCWEDAYAKIPFCVTRPFTIILIVQSHMPPILRNLLVVIGPNKLFYETISSY